MNFQTHNDNSSIDGVGTCLQFRNHPMTMERAVEVFGKPMPGECAEWVIRFDDGKEGTIYDWYGQWNIGGTDSEAALRIADLLKP